METITALFSAFAELSVDHLNALISLGGLGVAALAIYVVAVVVKGGKE